MSRSNPGDNLPNPSRRWFEWNGEQGGVRYYDKDAKQNVDVADFSFLLLDELGTVRGWHEASSSGIYSNEVRDTRQDVLVVKAFKGGTLAEGLYRDIRDRVSTLGGQFNANCYVGFKNGDGDLEIGAIRFKGAALGAWMEFRKANRAKLYEQAVDITGYTEGKKGRVIFRVPVFKLRPLSTESNNIAVALDKELQAFLDAYLKRTKRDQAEAVAAHAPVDDDGDLHPGSMPPLEDKDIPF